MNPHGGRVRIRRACAHVTFGLIVALCAAQAASAAPLPQGRFAGTTDPHISAANDITFRVSARRSAAGSSTGGPPASPARRSPTGPSWRLKCRWDGRGVEVARPECDRAVDYVRVIGNVANQQPDDLRKQRRV